MSPSSPKSLPQKVFSPKENLGLLGHPRTAMGDPYEFLKICKHFAGICWNFGFAGILATKSHHRNLGAEVSHENPRARSRTGDLAGVARNLARGNPPARSRRVEVQGDSARAARGDAQQPKAEPRARTA